MHTPPAYPVGMNASVSKGSRGAAGGLLIACAVHKEAEAVARGLGRTADLPPDLWTPIPLRDGIHVLVTGVGKANAAGAVAHALASNAHAAVLSAGVAGALPDSGLAVGATVRATACAFADEGIETPGGFTPIADLGFPTTRGIAGAHGDTLATTLDLPQAVTSRITAAGPIATVSLGAANDARAKSVAARTGALAEAMEGAAVALVGARLNVPFAEIRAISNRTGDRDTQNWDLPKALSALRDLFTHWP